MVTLTPLNPTADAVAPVEKTEIEESLAKKAKRPKKTKKINKLEFIVNIFNGKPGREGDVAHFAPITDREEIAEKLKEAEDKGYFRIRTGAKTDRNKEKYKAETSYYLRLASIKKLIDRKYTRRIKKVSQG